MTRALFVSDIHIASPTDERAKLFGRFLDKVYEIRPKHLFLVGDIFDLWIADRTYFVESYSDIIDKLVRLKKVGTEVHYFEGNHDLDLKRYWQHKLGFDVQDGPAFYEIDGQVIRVEHGDEMDPDDRGYLFLRWLLRTSPVVGLGRYLPNSAVRWIGSRASTTSRTYTTQVKVASDEQVIAKIRNHARDAYEYKPFDLLISGHVHVREDSTQTVGGGKFRCVNLGTWLKEPLVLDFKAGQAAFRSVEDFIQG